MILLGTSVLSFIWSMKRLCWRRVYLLCYCVTHKGFPCGSAGIESACNAGDLGLISGLGRSPGGRNGNPLQYSCLEKPMDGRAWQAIDHGVSKRLTQLRGFTFFLSGGSEGRESVCNVGDPGSIPGSGRSPGEGNGYPLQYSCLENSMDLEKPGKLQSMEQQRVEHNWVTNTFYL